MHAAETTTAQKADTTPSLKQQAADAKATYETTKAKALDIAHHAAVTKDEADSKAAEIQTAQDKVADIQTHLDDATTKLSDINTHLATAKTDLATAQANYDDATNGYQAATAKAADIQTHLDDAEAKLSDINSLLTPAKQEAETLSSDLATANQKIAEEATQLYKAQSDTTKAGEMTRAALTDAIARQKTTIEDLKTKLNSKNDEVSALQATHNSTEATVSALTAGLEQYQKKASDLQKAHNSADATVSALQAAHNSTEATVSALTAGLAQYQQKVSDLKEEASPINASYSALMDGGQRYQDKTTEAYLAYQKAEKAYEDYAQAQLDAHKKGSDFSQYKADENAATKNVSNLANGKGQATTPAQADIDAASKKDEANTAFRLGQQYGETGAVLPDLAGKSDNYKDNFAQGFNAGAATRAQKLASAERERNAEANKLENLPNKSTEASEAMEHEVNTNMNKLENLPNMSTLASEAAKDAALAKLQAEHDAAANNQGEDNNNQGKTTGTAVKTATKTPAAKTAAATTTAAAKTAAKAMPKTGDDVNTSAVVAGVGAAMLALFGLAETKKRRA